MHGHDEYAEGAEQGQAVPPEEWSDDEAAFEDDFVDVDIMEASMTAFGSVSCEEFGATGSAIANASVAGDAEVTASFIGALNADDVAMRQSAALAMVVSGDAAISQGGAQLIVAKSVEIETGAACCVMAGEATLARSWVGFMAARNATLSDDSRVIIDARAGLIIGAFLFGGLGLLAAAVYLGARRMAARMPHMPHLPHMGQTGHKGHMCRMGEMHMPHLAGLPKMPGVSSLGEMISKLRNAD